MRVWHLFAGGGVLVLALLAWFVFSDNKVNLMFQGSRMSEATHSTAVSVPAAGTREVDGADVGVSSEFIARAASQTSLAGQAVTRKGTVDARGIYEKQATRSFCRRLLCPIVLIQFRPFRQVVILGVVSSVTSGSPAGDVQQENRADGHPQ